MKKFFFTAFYLSLATWCFSQSIHEEEYNHYKQAGIPAEEYQHINQPAQLIQQREASSCNLNKIVFGWHPYWQNGMESNYQWSLLSHLSYFSYEVNSANGNAVTTNSWATAPVVTTALNNGIKVSLCVTLFANHATFLTSSTSKQTLISNVISLVQQRGANGVNIDFEALPSAQGANFTAFMLDLCSQFHTAIPGGEVSIALPSVDWSNTFDVAAMNSCVDYFFIMGYDYYYGGSAEAGPTDPLYTFNSSYNYNHTKSINYYLNRGAAANKLCLGLPYYGREWETTSSSIPSATTGNFNSSRTYKYVRDNSATYASHQYHAGSKSGYYTYQNGGNWRQCFINSPFTLGRRLEMVQLRGLAGIGIWALGYDDGYTDYWDKIEEKLTDCYTPACTDTLYDMGGPSQNYYDNENYTYTIAPANASTIDLSFFSFTAGAGDTLWLYDGSTTSAPLIGSYISSGSPGNLTTNTGSLTLKFKSDAATSSFGFRAYYYCNEMVTSINDGSIQEIALFPNPANNQLNIAGIMPIKNIRIYDINGRALYEEQINALKASINVSTFAPGIYNLLATTETGIITIKVVIAR